MGSPIARARRLDRSSDDDTLPGVVIGAFVVEFGVRADASSLRKILFDEYPDMEWTLDGIILGSLNYTHRK
jgi:hypothetical protein